MFIYFNTTIVLFVIRRFFDMSFLLKICVFVNDNNYVKKNIDLIVGLCTLFINIFYAIEKTIKIWCNQIINGCNYLYLIDNVINMG